MVRTQNAGTRRTRGRVSQPPAGVEKYLDETAQALATLDGDELKDLFTEAAANIADYARVKAITANRWLHDRMTHYRARALGTRNPESLTDIELIADFESKYGRLSPAYRRNLLAVLGRDSAERRRSGLDLLALKAFPSSPMQKLLISLRSVSNPAFDTLDQLRAVAAEIQDLAALPKTPGRHRRLRELQAEQRKLERALANSEGREPRRRTHKISRGYRELNPSPWDKADQLQKQVSDLDDQVDAVWASPDLSATQRDSKLTDLEAKLRNLRKQLEAEIRTAVYRSTTKNPRMQNGPLLDAFNFAAGADEMSQSDLVNSMRDLEARGFRFSTQTSAPRNLGNKGYAAKYGDGYLVVYVPEQVKGSRRSNPDAQGRHTVNDWVNEFAGFSSDALLDQLTRARKGQQVYRNDVRWRRIETAVKRILKNRGDHALLRNPLTPATAAFLSGYAVEYLGDKVTRKPRKRARRANPSELIEPYAIYKDDAGFFGIVDRRNGKPMRALDGTPYAFQFYAWAKTVTDNANREWLDNQGPARLTRRKRSRNAITPGARTKRVNARRMNPETAIADISRLFQGEVNGERLTLEAANGTPGALARIGTLDSLELKDGGARVEFESAFVGCDSDGDLHIAGFDLAMPDYAAPGPGQVMDMGEIEVINYTTAKQHITGGKVTSFYHNFGEDTGVKPHLVIDHEGMPIIAGGAYKIKTEGIVN